jgi:signal peptidase I
MTTSRRGALENPPVEQPSNDAAPGDGATAILPDAATARRRRRSSGTKQVIEWVLLIGTALAIALIIKTFLFQAFYIPSESMVPTLKIHDRVLVNKLSYKLHDIHRGDIVVFTKPKTEESDIKDLVKRVIALPGESVEGRDGHIYIDGKLLKEPYLPDGIVTSTFAAQPVPSNSIWVMGDNRPESRDSRYFGPIPESSVVGRVFVRIWPPTRLGFL